MTGHTLIRQLHRWLSILFTVAVVATSIALAQPSPIVWMSYLPLAPLAVLFLTGAYLFVLPHLIARRRAREGRQADAS